LEYKDYYKIMGVARDATQDDIKRAYRKLARKYHPDVSKESDAQSKFQEMQEAYEVLKDPEKRAAYDQLGANWRAGQDFRPPPDWDAGFEFSGGFSGDEESVFSDFFESLFGGRARQRGWSGGDFRQRGRDHHARILIDLEDAFHGATRGVSLQSPAVDESGHVVTHQRTLSVRIPKGVKQGQHIRLAGQGTPGIGGAEAGDLYLEVEFRPHRLYRVEGSDLYMELPVAPWEAALGAKVKVPTPGGVVDLTIAPDSRAGSKLRLKGRGIPGKQPGDLYVTLQVALPPARDEKAKQLYQQMREQMSFNPRARLGV
jgi:curved DNA-binding protein